MAATTPTDMTDDDILSELHVLLDDITSYNSRVLDGGTVDMIKEIEMTDRYNMLRSESQLRGTWKDFGYSIVTESFHHLITKL